MAAELNLADYDAVVADIYDAALAPAHWDVALTHLVSRFGEDRWDVAMLLWERVSPPAGRFLGACGVHAMAQHGYVHVFAGANDWSVRGHRQPVGSVFHSDQLIDRAAFRRSPFFTEYLDSYGFEVGLIALLDRHGGDHLCLCFPGPDGSSERLAGAVRRLTPHFQRSVRISRRLAEAELAAATARGALDAAPSAILMCDAGLQLTYANPAGEALLRDGYIGLRDGRLALPQPGETRRLQALGNPAEPLRCAAFALETEGQAPVAAMAVRIAPGSGLVHPDFGSAGLMIVGGRNHRTTFAHVDRLKDWFGLTPAEARLAAALAEGASLEDFAATRGVSLNAARFLLKGVFAKTDTNRQPQLVARLHETPLRWDAASGTPDLDSPLP
ncbi:PAS domain-containing protein [Phenylobacterium sp.]|uniref:PAS domain-containing protein n=1 Tax=Phenylobacterium sp. TaxID=1871053 RepID=UPI0025DF64CD|nr:PAS domain-containing protein [Phenylobacterium sp.]